MCKLQNVIMITPYHTIHQYVCHYLLSSVPQRSVQVSSSGFACTFHQWEILYGYRHCHHVGKHSGGIIVLWFPAGLWKKKYMDKNLYSNKKKKFWNVISDLQQRSVKDRSRKKRTNRDCRCGCFGHLHKESTMADFSMFVASEINGQNHVLQVYHSLTPLEHFWGCVDISRVLTTLRLRQQ